VLLALKVVLPRKPDLVISGINMGPNMGQDVNYSGTVAAAKEAAFAGCTSLAVSLNARDGFLFDDANRSVVDLLEKIRKETLPPSTLLNVNIPNISHEMIKGFMVTRLGKRVYNGNIIKRIDPRGGPYYWIGGDGGTYEAVEGTDLHAVDLGYVSLTPLHWDATSYSAIGRLTDILS
jgi:5'-nucleotidase